MEYGPVLTSEEDGPPREEPVRVSDLSFGEVGEILHLLQEVECSEIDLEWGDLRIQVRKNGAVPQATTMQESSTEPGLEGSELQVRSSPSQPVTSSASTEPPAADENDGHADLPSTWSAVAAPMAGTFYRSPSPGEPPFVEVDASVEVGETVALIEVMKLFTELKAEVAGKVVRIDVEDGSLVEFGQPLVWIEPV